ncbi:MAG: YkgJ family cysteine cluster protein [Burkholderiales bacterium]|nr:YkgJ family cysteine cluster protein [Burkholderiales bacterium]
MAEEDPQVRRGRQAAFLRGLYEGQLARLREARAEDPLELARRMHDEIDATVARDRRADARSAGIRCGSGCNHCCRGPVQVWPQQAALLADFLLREGLAPDLAKLGRQSRYTVDDWHEQPAADRACVFLRADGACEVYPVRPGACRKLLVTSEPQYCDAGRGEYERVERWFSWEAEMIEIAALETFGMEMLPVALLAAWRGREPGRDS